MATAPSTNLLPSDPRVQQVHYETAENFDNIYASLPSSKFGDWFTPHRVAVPSLDYAEFCHYAWSLPYGSYPHGMKLEDLQEIRAIRIKTYHYYGLVWIGGCCRQYLIPQFEKYVRHLTLVYAEEREEVLYYLPVGVLDAIMSDTVFINLRYHVSVNPPQIMCSNQIVLEGHPHNIKKAITHIEAIIGELLRLKNNCIKNSCPCPPPRK